MILSKTPKNEETSKNNVKEIKKKSNIENEIHLTSNIKRNNTQKIFRVNTFNNNTINIKRTRIHKKSSTIKNIERKFTNKFNIMNDSSKRLLEAKTAKNNRKNNNSIKYINSKYVKKIRMKPDIMRKYFNSFFLKLLTYDKDF